MTIGGRTLYDKIWDDHIVERRADGTVLLSIDQVLIYEAGSAQAFKRLAERGASVRRPERILAVPDHAIPTDDRARAALDETTRSMLYLLASNCAKHGVEHVGVDDPRQGIVHVMGPELGLTLPGMVLCCVDSHTSTHGAFGAVAFGVGASELEHVFATQTLVQGPSRTMRITVTGDAAPEIVAKDIILAIIGMIGARGGTGHAIEFAGAAIRRLSMEGRMTLCNMAVEAGARIGLVAPDEATFDWLKGRPRAPDEAAWDQAVAYWRTLYSDADAGFDREHHLDVSRLAPQISWGTSPEHVIGVDGVVPDPADAPDAEHAASWRRALDYMGLKPGRPLADLPIDRVFIGSCTNGRIEDLRAAAAVVGNRKVAEGVHAMVVPGSAAVRRQAEQEGLDRIFIAAGFDWRLPGCSMCFGSRFDFVAPGHRCVSTSNRNFENRQGRGARTHITSPAIAAAAAIAGRIVNLHERAAR